MSHHELVFRSSHFERAEECRITCQGYLPLQCCGEFCERLANQRAKAAPPVPDERGVSVDNPQPDQLRTTTDATSSSPEPFMYEDDLPEYMTKEEYSDWYAKSWVDGVRMGPVFTRERSAENQHKDWILEALRLARNLCVHGNPNALTHHLLQQETLHMQQVQAHAKSAEDCFIFAAECFEGTRAFNFVCADGYANGQNIGGELRVMSTQVDAMVTT